jgi:hypothetical protein
VEAPMSANLRSLCGGMLVLIGFVGLAIFPGISVPSQSPRPTECFLRRDWTGTWRVTPDARTMYIHVGRSVYRLDLAEAYPLLRSPWAILHDTDSSDTICTGIDFRLSVSDRNGAWQVPIVRKMTRLTPERAAALPKSLRP